MKGQLTEIKLNIKSGRLRLRDLKWLVETIEQQGAELEQQAIELEHLRTVNQTYQAMKKAL